MREGGREGGSCRVKIVQNGAEMALRAYTTYVPAYLEIEEKRLGIASYYDRTYTSCTYVHVHVHMYIV
jgi:hypothetical protein